MKRWFRALDQRVIRIGVREWLVQVTGIHVQGDDVWIQIADGNNGNSILLHVTAVTPIERAVHALARRVPRGSSERPIVVSVTATTDRYDYSYTRIVH